MFRYLLFAFEYYYPGGGMLDCILKTNDLSEIIKIVEKDEEEYDEYHVYDCEKDVVIKEMHELEEGI